MKLNSYCDIISRWSQLKFVLFSPQKLGEMIDFDVHIFSDGLVQPPTTCLHSSNTSCFKELSKNRLCPFAEDPLD